MTIMMSKPATVADPERVPDVDQVPDDGQPGALASVPPEPWEPSPLRGPLERFTRRPLPTPRTVYASGKWWTLTLGKAAVQLLLRSPQLLILQLPHIWRGVLRGGHSYAQWRAQPEWMAAAKEADPNKRSVEIGKVKGRIRGATRLTLTTLALLVLGVVVAVRMGYGAHVLAALIGLLALLDAAGRRGAPAAAGPAIMPCSPFREGASSRMVVADVHAVLVENGHDPDRCVVTDPRVGKFGMSLQVHSPKEISEEAIYAIERGLQTARGAASVVANPDNAAVCELRLWWTDPLAGSRVPPWREPNSQTVATPAELGYGVGGVDLLINFKRTNIIMVGRTGSGKSSALWSTIDWLSTCHDVVLHGIDLSGGPVLRAWGEVFQTRAWTRAQAKALLQERIASAYARTAYLAERSEPRVGGPVPGSENWETSDGKFHILIVDELPVLALDEELLELLQEHQRVGRKAGETSILATQDLSGDTIGATSIRKQPSTIILFACSREDVTTALGGGKIKEGWTPHRLKAAEGDNPWDAGKCFISSGRHTTPIPWRFDRLDDIGEIHRRALERMAAGRPDPDDTTQVPVDAVVLPPVLATLLDAFAAAGNPEFLPTEELLGLLDPRGGPATDTKLSAAVKPFGLGSSRQRHGGRPTRGYRRAAVEAAVAAL